MSDNKSISERLEAVRHIAEAEGADMYIVPIGDSHGSEYISDHFKCLEYITGFTGSAGTAIVLGGRLAGAAPAVLWTDGRYFLQAEAELRGTGIEVMRSGEPGVPTLYEYIETHLRPGMGVGFDGRMLSAEQGVAIENIAEKQGATLYPRLDPFDEIYGTDRAWPARPEPEFRGIFEYGEEYAGQGGAAKVAALRARIAKENADAVVISALDDIAWLLNLRGSDIPYNPVFFAHLTVTASELKIFVPEANTDAFRALCPYAEVLRYEDFYNVLQSLASGTCVLLDKSSVNFAAYKCILHTSQAEIKDIPNAALLPKHIKNDTEMRNIRAAHLKDGIAVTKFIYHLKKRIKNGEHITEQDAAEMLETFRQAQDGYINPSFSPIIAYGEHGAIMHYSTEHAGTGQTVIARAGFLLADTGGQYLQGTTDITRTLAMGPLSREQKQHYTAVLKGNLNLAATVFPAGTTGLHLDAIARKPLWKIGLDYNHGTGHGVGCFLNVHEGPVAISRKSKIAGDFPLQAGMLISDEPGVYLSGCYGIRLENLMLCVQDSQHLGFLAFDTVTRVPFERDAILPEEMDEIEKSLLNAYHEAVRDALLPYMDEEETAWLKEQTAPLL